MRRLRRWSVGAATLLLVGSCAEPYSRPLPPPAPVAAMRPAPAPAQPAARFTFAGALSQGGLVRGTAPAGTTLLTLDGRPVPVFPDGGFAIGFDRDAGPAARLVATLRDGRQVSELLQVGPREWAISRLSTLPKIPLPTPQFARLRPAELAEINAARAQRTVADGWRQDFLWPAVGRISTRFGSQRIYADGAAGSYHSGIDIARPAGSVVLAPADGMVTLAADRPFTLEGYLLLVDHGGGVESALMHLSRIDVRAGERVRRGQPVGLVGSTGRSTGPHLHWGLRWGAARLDPLLAAGPMPVAD